MGKLICIDSQIFIWGIKQQSIPEQASLIPRAISFIDWLAENDMSILLPAPMLAELLSPVPEDEHSKIISLIDKRFHVAPFDKLASMKCADLIHKTSTQKELKQYRLTHSVPKAKLKYDCMITAIAITRRAACIYSEDNDIEKFACGQIPVFAMPNIPIQKRMDLKFHEDEDEPF